MANKLRNEKMKRAFSVVFLITKIVLMEYQRDCLRVTGFFLLKVEIIFY